ncbi:head-tail connector protein [Paenirhodobacter sp.]|uniref:head-tail connector protein n=1 Tax=Paenirhodobacter sp. TaxID=1965326 RepID=UPI003B413E24
MMLREISVVPNSALPLDEFASHMRLGTGFSGAGGEDAALIAYLRAALAAIEGRTAKVLLSRDFTLSLAYWRGSVQPLAVAPVSAVTEVRIVGADGTVTTVEPERYRLVRDLARPRLEGRGGMLPVLPEGATAEIDLTAGFGPEWSNLPVDLQQAVFLLATQYFELRHDGAAEISAMPFGVMALIERWRTVRVLGGRG